MQAITAYVKGSPRQVKTKYGDRSVLDVTLPTGEVTAVIPVKVTASPSDAIDTLISRYASIMNKCRLQIINQMGSKSVLSELRYYTVTFEIFQR